MRKQANLANTPKRNYTADQMNLSGHSVTTKELSRFSTALFPLTLSFSHKGRGNPKTTSSNKGKSLEVSTQTFRRLNFSGSASADLPGSHQTPCPSAPSPADRPECRHAPRVRALSSARGGYACRRLQPR